MTFFFFFFFFAFQFLGGGGPGPWAPPPGHAPVYVEYGVKSIKGLGQMQGRQTGGWGLGVATPPPHLPQILEGELNACQPSPPRF